MKNEKGFSVPPWTDEEVKNLNEFQTLGSMHPFTCGGKKDGKDCRADLVATKDGWICPEGCGYTQKWAHDFMANGAVVRHDKELMQKYPKFAKLWGRDENSDEQGPTEPKPQ